MLCIDESRVICCSRRQENRNYNPDKPIRFGIDIFAICDRGEFLKGLVLWSMVNAAKLTFEVDPLDEIIDHIDGPFDDENELEQDIQVLSENDNDLEMLDKNTNQVNRSVKKYK